MESTNLKNYFNFIFLKHLFHICIPQNDDHIKLLKESFRLLDLNVISEAEFECTVLISLTLKLHDLIVLAGDASKDHEICLAYVNQSLQLTDQLLYSSCSGVKEVRKQVLSIKRAVEGRRGSSVWTCYVKQLNSGITMLRPDAEASWWISKDDDPPGNGDLPSAILALSRTGLATAYSGIVDAVFTRLCARWEAARSKNAFAERIKALKSLFEDDSTPQEPTKARPPRGESADADTPPCLPTCPPSSPPRPPQFRAPRPPSPQTRTSPRSHSVPPPSQSPPSHRPPPPQSGPPLPPTAPQSRSPPPPRSSRPPPPRSSRSPPPRSSRPPPRSPPPRSSRPPPRSPPRSSRSPPRSPPPPRSSRPPPRSPPPRSSRPPPRSPPRAPQSPRPPAGSPSESERARRVRQFVEQNAVSPPRALLGPSLVSRQRALFPIDPEPLCGPSPAASSVVQAVRRSRLPGRVKVGGKHKRKRLQLSSDSDSHSDEKRKRQRISSNTDSPPVGAGSVSNRSTKTSRSRLPWSMSETQRFLDAICRFGLDWATIKMRAFHDSPRTNVNLKDRYRTLCQQGIFKDLYEEAKQRVKRRP